MAARFWGRCLGGGGWGGVGCRVGSVVFGDRGGFGGFWMVGGGGGWRQTIGAPTRFRIAYENGYLDIRSV